MTGLPALLGALGLVGVLFGLLSLIVILVSGAGLTSDIGWIAGNLVIGVLLLVSAALLNVDKLRERLSSGEARRAGRYGTSAILSTVLAIAVLGMLGFLATRYAKQFDWSEQKVHTLSDQTQKVVTGLDRDAEVLVLVNRLDEPPIRELLDRYARLSERFQVEYADPNARPGLLQQYGITPEELGAGRGLVRVAIEGDSLTLGEISEEAVTNALVKLTRTGEKVVYFLEGHGERPIGREGEVERTGYQLAAEALRNEAYGVEPLLLASMADVPDDADVVVIAGPRRNLLDAERQALERYLARGGAILALVDPRVQTNVADALADWGVKLGDDVVVDRTLALLGRAMSPFGASYAPAHPITEALREPVLFHEVRSVTGQEGFTELVFTGDASWAERDFALLDAEGKVAQDDSDLDGPVPVATAGRPTVPPAAVPAAAQAPAEAADPQAAGASAEAVDAAPEDAEAPEGGEGDDGKAALEEARLVVFGDADFAANEFLDFATNRNLFVNSVNWLLGDVEAIAVRPNQSRASRFQLSAEQFRTIRSLSLFVLPEAIAVLGVFTWWRRRNPAGSAS